MTNALARVRVTCVAGSGAPALVRLVIGSLVALATAAPVVADAPMPPTPDEAADIQPVAFAAAADRPQDAPPLPLTGGPAASLSDRRTDQPGRLVTSESAKD